MYWVREVLCFRCIRCSNRVCCLLCPCRLCLFMLVSKSISCWFLVLSEFEFSAGFHFGFWMFGFEVESFLLMYNRVTQFVYKGVSLVCASLSFSLCLYCQFTEFSFMQFCRVNKQVYWVAVPCCCGRVTNVEFDVLRVESFILPCSRVVSFCLCAFCVE